MKNKKVYTITIDNLKEEFYIEEYELVANYGDVCLVKDKSGQGIYLYASKLFDSPSAAIYAKEDELDRSKLQIDKLLCMIWRLYRKENGRFVNKQC